MSAVNKFCNVEKLDEATSIVMFVQHYNTHNEKETLTVDSIAADLLEVVLQRAFNMASF